MQEQLLAAQAGGGRAHGRRPRRRGRWCASRVTGGVESERGAHRARGGRPRRPRAARGPRAGRPPRRRAPGAAAPGVGRWAASTSARSASAVWAAPTPATPGDRLRGPGQPGALGPGLGLMAAYAAPVQDLIDELGRLPGIGPKSAQRIAFHLLKLPGRGRHPPGPRHHRGQGPGHASAPGASTSPRAPLCGICTDDRRDAHRASAWSRSPRHRGRREDRRVPRPLPRAAGRHQPDRRHRPRPAARSGSCWPASSPRASHEVILCTNPNIEGEATAMYLARLLQAARAPGHPHRQRPARRRRPRVRRRAHARPGPRGPPGGRGLSGPGAGMHRGAAPRVGSGRTGQLEERHPRSNRT